MSRNGAKTHSKPNWLRWLGRDYPAAFELQLRAREKTRILARQALARAGGTPRRQAARHLDPPLGGEATVLALSSLGIEPADLLMVHSSWDSSRTFASTPMALIDALRIAIGESGTLCMPAYPPFGVVAASGFDVRRSPSQAGLITEVFRRMPGAVRSAQVRSVVALGPLADELTREHPFSPFASGPSSPWGKLAAHRGKVLFLGVGPENNTMFHCGEDFLGEEFPVQVYENAPEEIRVVFANGTGGTVRAYVRSARWTYCCDAIRMLPYFDDITTTRSIAGVQASLVNADHFLARLLSLARHGVHMYGFRFPSTTADALATE